MPILFALCLHLKGGLESGENTHPPPLFIHGYGGFKFVVVLENHMEKVHGPSVNVSDAVAQGKDLETRFP